MEAGKLVGTALVGATLGATGGLLRVTLTALIVALAVINAVGVYGRLTSAHLTEHVAALASTEQEASTIGARIEAQIHVVGISTSASARSTKLSRRRPSGAGASPPWCLPQPASHSNRLFSNELRSCATHRHGSSGPNLFAKRLYGTSCSPRSYISRGTQRGTFAWKT
jgi:hypothetical protein